MLPTEVLCIFHTHTVCVRVLLNSQVSWASTFKKKNKNVVNFLFFIRFIGGFETSITKDNYFVDRLAYTHAILGEAVGNVSS